MTPPIPTRTEVWLSLGPAARLVGVDPDTLRRWSDEGRIETYLTPGGHRRFERAALDRLVDARRRGNGRASPGGLAGLGTTTDRVSAAYRRRYAAPRTPEGQAADAVPDPERGAFRRDGRRLVEALLGYLDAADAAGRARAELEAGRLVDDLATRLAAGGMSLTDAAAHFVAARRPFLAELARQGRRRRLDAERLRRIYESASQLLDRLLLRLIATHQAALAAADPEAGAAST